jgi:hypothetical protein
MALRSPSQFRRPCSYRRTPDAQEVMTTLTEDYENKPIPPEEDQ